MNKKQRELVAVKLAALVSLKEQIESIGEELSDIASEEQEKFDNMPENMQGGEKGEAMETAAANLFEAAQYCEDGDAGNAISSLESIE